MSYQPSSNVQTTLKGLLDARIMKSIIIRMVTDIKGNQESEHIIKPNNAALLDGSFFWEKAVSLNSSPSFTPYISRKTNVISV